MPVLPQHTSNYHVMWTGQVKGSRIKGSRRLDHSFGSLLRATDFMKELPCRAKALLVMPDGTVWQADIFGFRFVYQLDTKVKGAAA